ncbi:EAL domain-containing protein [Coralloluteibacterium stylophorae]|uniref:EAL domain-containing protein n=1 Tax=Coralloluteibacterium stylophorae TaxID=1776034 RepID=A0A8J8AWH4_9GAMM|nr:EAL domain-containing protein [Coralloluteibacterium stylophorae]MBS7458462.1 EAL domain-containing protein [Coralloluteibacterium stylophorae]
MSELEQTRLAELRQAYLRHLPQRVQALAGRIQRYGEQGWDAPGLALLHEDVQRLAGASGRYGLVQASQRLLALESLLGTHRERQTLPDAEGQRQLAALIQELGSQTPSMLAAQESAGATAALPSEAAPAAATAPQATAVGTDAADGSADAEADAAPPRILVVEDNRSEAIYAEGILQSAGMRTRVVDQADEVVPALEAFQPDLVLMDLYLPDVDGMTLTARIRENEAFLHLPIVFLSGEEDPDKQFEAIDAGGDDFLSKPVRARHLIAAVNTRVRRARALARRTTAPAPARDPRTGLHERRWLLDHLDAGLATGFGSADAPGGGVLFIEMIGAAQLRERVGLHALDRVADGVAAMIARRLGDMPVARWGDGSFLAYAREGDDAALETLARGVREALASHDIDLQGTRLRARVTVGVCSLSHRFADLNALLEAVERAARSARAAPVGVVAFAPPQHPSQARESGLLERIREAIDGSGFELIYQPIVAVAGGDHAQYQALLRLRELDGKVYPAAEVLPLAERSGLMPAIDRWVVDHALDAVGALASDGGPPRLFVSQSPLTIAAPDQARWLGARLERPGLADALILELRLDEVLPYLDEVEAFCRDIAARGVRFCLSQFQGADGERLLERLPLAYVKLAPRFASAVVEAAVRDELRALIEKAHAREVKVIGHRIEDAQAAAALWMSGIDYLQGNLVQAPGRELGFDFQQAVL